MRLTNPNRTLDALEVFLPLNNPLLHIFLLFRFIWADLYKYMFCYFYNIHGNFCIKIQKKNNVINNKSTANFYQNKINIGTNGPNYRLSGTNWSSTNSNHPDSLFSHIKCTKTIWATRTSKVRPSILTSSNLKRICQIKWYEWNCPKHFQHLYWL